MTDTNKTSGASADVLAVLLKALEHVNYDCPDDDYVELSRTIKAVADLIAERDALAAEVKALREKLADLADAADGVMECGFNVPATPSRRILRAAIDAARASAATDGGGNE